MRNQLYDRYMQTDRCDYGLYLVGWYCCSFDDRNEINCDCIENAKEYFEQQSEELSKANNINIKSFVLDCRLRN